MRHRDDNDWIIEVEGFLGIVEIMSVQHLMVIVSKQEVACLPHRHNQYDPDTPASIYELQEIELIPFRDVVAENRHDPNKQGGGQQDVTDAHFLEY